MTLGFKVRAAEQGVAITLSDAACPGTEIVLPTAAAVQLAREILATAGEKPAFPTSRQIGGIIGPY